MIAPSNRQFSMALLGYGGHTLLETRDCAKALELVRASGPT
jgi:hypothetical protein